MKYTGYVGANGKEHVKLELGDKFKMVGRPQHLVAGQGNNLKYDKYLIDGVDLNANKEVVIELTKGQHNSVVKYDWLIGQDCITNAYDTQYRKNCVGIRAVKITQQKLENRLEPNNEEGFIPEPLRGEWLDNVKSMKEEFNLLFVDDQGNPTEQYYEWLLDSSKDGCDSDVFVNMQKMLGDETTKESMNKLFIALRKQM